jgi:hypothetical protein
MYNGSTGTTSGTISAQNVASPNGNTPTANSTVTCPLGGIYDTGVVQVTGTYTGVLTVQVQLDNGTWVDLTGATSLINVGAGTQSANIASGVQGIFQFDVAGFSGFRVTAKAAVTGSATVTVSAGNGNGAVGIDTPVQIAGSLTIGSLPAGTGHNYLSAATTNAQAPKTSAGSVFELDLTNFSATPRYFKFYDKASAPTVGTDLPILVIDIAANSTKTIEFGNIGKRFSAGIAYAITGAQASADTTAIVAGDVRVSMTYI